MVDRAGEHVGNRLDAAVRVPREPREVVIGVLVAKIVEQQKRIELGRVAEAERALQPDAGAFERRLGVKHLFDRSNGHYVVTASLSDARRIARFVTPPTIPIRSAVDATADVHHAVRPSSASSEYCPGPISASAAAAVP